MELEPRITPNTTSLMKLLDQSIPNPRNQARSANLGQGADFDCVCKDIHAKDVGAMTRCVQMAATDSAATPNATALMKLWNQSFQNPRNHARSASLGGGVDYDSYLQGH